MLKYSPSRVFPVFKQLTNFIVSAMMALLGSASPALLASDTASPKSLRQGSGVNSITWCTFVTSRPINQSINQSINFNLNSHKHFYSVEKKKIEYI